MSVCEMQQEYELAQRRCAARDGSTVSTPRTGVKHGKAEERTKPKDVKIKQAGGIGALYCSMLSQASRQIDRLFKVKEAHAEVPPRPQQDTTKKPAAAEESRLGHGAHRDDSQKGPARQDSAGRLHPGDARTSSSRLRGSR